VQFNRFRGIWYRIEEFEVELAERYGRVYGVSGPVFQDNIDTIGANHVTVPGHFFKVILFLDDDELWQAVGFLTPHSKDSQTSVDEFIQPIEEIEELSGIDFNCFLPDSSQQRIEKIGG
jgi:endonuclease G